MTLQIKISGATIYAQSDENLTTAVRVIGRDNRIFSTRFSLKFTPEWEDQFECSVEERQLRFELVNRGNDVIATAEIEFDEETYKPFITTVRKINLEKNGNVMAELRFSIRYNNGLMFVGAQGSKKLDLSAVNLSISRASNLAGTHEERNKDSNVNLQGGFRSNSGTRHPNNPNNPSHNQIDRRNDGTVTLGNEEISLVNRILKIHANRCNIFSWMDDFSQKLSFEFVPRKIRRSPE